MPNYSNDTEMAAYGRSRYRSSEMRKAKETIRDAAVSIQRADTEERILSVKAMLDEAFSKLLEAVRLK